MAVIVIQLNRTKNLEVAQGYVLASCNGDDTAESFYGDVESEVNKVNAQYTTMIGDDAIVKRGRQKSAHREMSE